MNAPIYASEDQDLHPPGPVITGSAALSFLGTTGTNGQCALQLNALPSVPDTGSLSFAGWFKTAQDWNAVNNWTPWVLDPYNYVTYFQNSGSGWNYSASTPTLGGITQYLDSCPDGYPQSLSTPGGTTVGYPPSQSNGWIHIMGTAVLRVSDGGLLYTMYLNGNWPSTFYTYGGITSPGDVIAMAGLPLIIGSDGYRASDSFQFELFDFSFWPNVNWISSQAQQPGFNQGIFATAGNILLPLRRLFVNALGQPCAPSVAINALGRPAVMLTGGLAGSLANSLGTAGPLQVADGVPWGNPGSYDAPTDGLGMNYGNPTASRAYTPVGVQFTGTTGMHGKCGIHLPSLGTVPNNGKWSFAGWFKCVDWNDNHGVRSVAFPYAFIANSLSIPYAHGDGAAFVRIASPPPYTGDYFWQQIIYSNAAVAGVAGDPANNDAPLWLNGSWIHLMGMVDASSTSAFSTVNVEGLNANNGLPGGQVGIPFAPVLSGKDFWLGDDGHGNGFYCAVADFSFWPGFAFPTLPDPRGGMSSNIDQRYRRAFVDDFRSPVPPSQTLAIMSSLAGVSPSLMLTGGVSGFLANTLGTAGPLSVPSGYDAPSTAADTPPDNL